MKKLIIRTLLIIGVGMSSDAFAQDFDKNANQNPFISLGISGAGGDMYQNSFNVQFRAGVPLNNNLFIGPIIGYSTVENQSIYNEDFEQAEFGGFLRKRFPVSNNFYFSTDFAGSITKNIAVKSISNTTNVGLTFDAEYRPIKEFSIRMLLGGVIFNSYDGKSGVVYNFGLNNPRLELSYHLK
ncbi:MAG: hypothetical protein ACPGSD_02520 [Flavobacteriales bacterium]